MYRHTYAEIHKYTSIWGFTRAVIPCTVCASIYAVASSSRLGRCSFFSICSLLWVELVAATNDASIQSIRTLDHLDDRWHRAIERIELNFGVSVSNSRRTDAFRGCKSSLLRTEFSELHRARYCCEGILLFEAANEENVATLRCA